MIKIKFRAWDKEEKGMISFKKLLIPKDVDTGSTLDCILDGESKNEFDYSDYKNGYILMQFTGLNDKNGNDIYEGDIVRIPMSTCAGGEDKNFETVEIVFEDGHAYMNTSKIYKNQPRVLFFKNHASKSEVIGNIYER